MWPPRSPDLSPPNYCIGATLKTMPSAITHAVWNNRTPTYPTSLPHFTHDATGCVYERTLSCAVLYVACWVILSELLLTAFIANNLLLVWNHHITHSSFARLGLVFWYLTLLTLITLDSTLKDSLYRPRPTIVCRAARNLIFKVK
jgi:hypothetical protein